MIAYLDCVGGLAGDMLLAALLDAGAAEEVLQRVPEQLGLDGVHVDVRRAERHGISALRLDVVGGDGAERSWQEIRELLAGAALSSRVADRAQRVFERLAEAEAKVHAVAPDDVHFHELGSADTLVDVVGAVALLDDRGVERLVCSPLPAGRGVVRAAHGVLPVPAPATAELLVGAPVYGVDVEGELVTPTGAALASSLADEWGPMPAMRVERIGYGAGTRDPAERPNVVRVLLGEAGGPASRDVVLVETNLDDLLPELVPDAVERCFAAGALDVWTVPVAMKKGRPGIVLSALARPDVEEAVADAMLRETTALGVRVSRLRRHELDREERAVDVEGRSVRIKVGRLDGRVVNLAPEHDDCAAVARATGMPVKSVWAAALAAAREIA